MANLHEQSRAYAYTLRTAAALLIAAAICIGLTCGPRPADVERITHTEQYKAAERAHAAKLHAQENFWR